jgi:hypothetical protein
VKSRHRFTYLPRSTKNDGLIDAYRILADPIDPREKDALHFYTDESESIRTSKNTPASELRQKLQ